MDHLHFPPAGRAGLKPFVRNRFYYGKLMDVYHFELETNYQNGKRHLINRLVFGAGVVCGLDVQGHLKDDRHVHITPGLAIDWWGREIIVPHKIGPIPIPEDKVRQAIMWAKERAEDETSLQVMLCYHECLADPAPVLAGDCGAIEQCTPGAIREQYCVEFRPGCAEECERDCHFEHIIEEGHIDLEELARWVSHRECELDGESPDICLANINFEFDVSQNEPLWDQSRIDITVRPICYSADLLFRLIVALANPEARHRARSK